VSLHQVLSPLPQFINPGNTAWADGGGSPLIYVMRCNPQHYYLLHEIGHRFGMPHATIYKLTNKTASPEVRTIYCLPKERWPPILLSKVVCKPSGVCCSHPFP